MNYLAIILSLVTLLSTLLGGVVILKFRRSISYFFAFAAGSLIAVAFLGILPESLEISRSIGFPVRYIMIAIVFSLFAYSLLDRYFLTHEIGNGSDGHIMGPIGAGSLVILSFLDGTAIGTAFQVNASIGIIVALAIIFHDFTDGINTVIVMLKNKQQMSRTITFLFLDAITPVVGVVVTSSVSIPERILAVLLAVFVGEFLYIGATTLLPETHKYPSKGMVLAMALGIILITILTSLI
jgi:ZIP family zinc transporter